MDSIDYSRASQLPHWVTNRPTATIHPHWCHTSSTVAYSESLVFCSTLGGTFDRNVKLLVYDHGCMDSPKTENLQHCSKGGEGIEAALNPTVNTSSTCRPANIA